MHFSLDLNFKNCVNLKSEKSGFSGSIVDQDKH